MGRKMIRPRLEVCSHFGSRDGQPVLESYIRAVISGNEYLKSSFDRIAASRFREYNSGKKREVS